MQYRGDVMGAIEAGAGDDELLDLFGALEDVVELARVLATCLRCRSMCR